MNQSLHITLVIVLIQNKTIYFFPSLILLFSTLLLFVFLLVSLYLRLRLLLCLSRCRPVHLLHCLLDLCHFSIEVKHSFFFLLGASDRILADRTLDQVFADEAHDLSL